MKCPGGGIWIVVVLVSAAPLVRGHDGPLDVIQRIDATIRREGPTARLLASRAFEHSTLGNLDAAIVDFRAALAMEPGSRVAALGCIEALLANGESAQAADLARTVLAHPGDPSVQAPFHAALARIHAREEDWASALENWRLALGSPQPEVDWFMGETQALAALGRLDEQVDALAAAMKRNPSIVLKRAWIHALVEAGALETAAREIEIGLAEARWKSSWLLLRARVHALRNEPAGQHADAAAALAEIQRRLHPEHPDPYLVDEAVQARALLGG